MLFFIFFRTSTYRHNQLLLVAKMRNSNQVEMNGKLNIIFLFNSSYIVLIQLQPLYVSCTGLGEV